MDELQKGNSVMIEFHGDTERSALTRSIRRRAANRGFKTDIRQATVSLGQAGGRIAASKGSEAATPRARKPREGQSGAQSSGGTRVPGRPAARGAIPDSEWRFSLAPNLI